MTAGPHQHVPTRYSIRVAGHLDQRWSAWFENLTLTQEGDGSTTLCGAVADQAALHGLLARIRDLGLVLMSLEADKADDNDTRLFR